MIFVGGSRLLINGHKVFDAPTGHAAIRRLGNELYIKTDRVRRRKRVGFVERRTGDRRKGGSDRRSKR
jgi:hypothetical protein